MHWRLSMILKTSNKSEWSNVFWYVKVYIFWNFTQYTIHSDKTQMLNKFPWAKINVTKNELFFFRKLELIIVLLLIHNSYTSLSTRFISLNLCVGFSIFESVSFLLYLYFCSTKSTDSLTLKCHKSFQSKK